MWFADAQTRTSNTHESSPLGVWYPAGASECVGETRFESLVFRVPTDAKPGWLSIPCATSNASEPRIDRVR
jgi:hypothetical protein